jgi:hypothetical protein
MVEMFIVAGIASLLAAIIGALIGALIALRTQHDDTNKIQVRNQAWERAQEAHQHNWEIKQEKHVAEVEMRLTRQVQQVQKGWEEWDIKDQQHLKELAKQFEDAVAQLQVEHQLARLPRIEDVALILDAGHQHQYTLPNRQPPMLQGTNLSERDFSHHYLGHADLRNAQLVNANFYMADLSGALLSGANLAGADLSGANLAGADLRDATLTGANLLIADLHSAILVGTNVRGAHNVTAEQISTTIYDSSTQFDAKVDTIGPCRHDLQSAIPISTPEIAGAAKSPHIMSTETSLETNEPAMVRPPETPLPPLLDDTELLILPKEDEPLLSSPLLSNNSLPDPAVPDLPGDVQENTRTEVFDPATPRLAHNGKKRGNAS